MPGVPRAKAEEVKLLTELFKKYPVMGIAELLGLPSPQLQAIRNKLRGKAIIRVSKITLIKIAMKNAGKEELKENLKGPIALIFTDINAFKLYNTIKSCRTKAPARTGQTAPYDITVPAGDTGIPPGPILGELRNAGINAKIDGGSIKVIRDSTICKKGEQITPEQAVAMAKLGIKPMEVGMSVPVVLEEGVMFGPDQLDIDEEQTIASLQQAYRNAFNLAVNTAYPTKETIECILQKAYFNAINLGVNAMVLDKGIVEELLKKAFGQALVLSSHIK